ncbi:TPA: holin [Raoultella ornithinolytica]|nr:holin [Raoultella ornithinolytica]
MQSGGEVTVWKLIFIGAVITLGKLLADGEAITVRLALGRLILGSAVSCVAGVALIHFDSIPDLALIGIASGLGIVGHTVIEALLHRWARSREGKSE